MPKNTIKEMINMTKVCNNCLTGELVVVDWEFDTPPEDVRYVNGEKLFVDYECSKCRCETFDVVDVE